MKDAERNLAPVRPRQFRQTGTADNHTVRSLDEVADILGLSRQRVHDIEKSAFKKLRRAFVRHSPSLELERNEQGSVCGLKEMEHSSPG